MKYDYTDKAIYTRTSNTAVSVMSSSPLGSFGSWEAKSTVLFVIHASLSECCWERSGCILGPINSDRHQIRHWEVIWNNPSLLRLDGQTYTNHLQHSLFLYKVGYSRMRNFWRYSSIFSSSFQDTTLNLQNSNLPVKTT